MKAKKQLKAKSDHKTGSAASRKRAVASKAEQHEEQMPRVNPHAGGIDCGAEEHYVAVPLESVKPGESCALLQVLLLMGWIPWSSG
jgi:hypothetical protein